MHSWSFSFHWLRGNKVWNSCLGSRDRSCVFRMAEIPCQFWSAYLWTIMQYTMDFYLVSALLSIWIMVTLNFPVSFSIPWIVSFSLLPPESRYYPHLYLRAGCGSQQCFWLILSSVFSSFPRDVSTTVKDVSGTSWEHWSFLSALPFPVWYSVLRTQLHWHPQLLPLSRSWHLLAPLGLLFRR